MDHLIDPCFPSRFQQTASPADVDFSEFATRFTDGDFSDGVDDFLHALTSGRDGVRVSDIAAAEINSWDFFRQILNIENSNLFALAQQEFDDFKSTKTGASGH